MRKSRLFGSGLFFFDNIKLKKYKKVKYYTFYYYDIPTILLYYDYTIIIIILSY
jgi:hypothetical protein